MQEVHTHCVLSLMGVDYSKIFLNLTQNLQIYSYILVLRLQYIFDVISNKVYEYILTAE